MSLASVFMRDEWVAAAKEDDFIDLQPLDAVFWIPAGASFWFESPPHQNDAPAGIQKTAGASFWFESPPLKGWAAGKMIPRHEMFFEKEIL